MRQNESSGRAEFGVVDQRLTALRSQNTPPSAQAARSEDLPSKLNAHRDADAFEAERWDGMS